MENERKDLGGGRVLSIDALRGFDMFWIIGVNAITIYFLQNVIDFERVAGFFLRGLADHAGLYKPLVLLSGALAARWLFLWSLYRHKIFFRV